jgi:hypothetical protein
MTSDVIWRLRYDVWSVMWEVWNLLLEDTYGLTPGEVQYLKICDHHYLSIFLDNDPEKLVHNTINIVTFFVDHNIINTKTSRNY